MVALPVVAVAVAAVVGGKISVYESIVFLYLFCFFGDFIEKHYLSFFCVDFFPHCSESWNSSDYPVTGI